MNKQDVNDAARTKGRRRSWVRKVTRLFVFVENSSCRAAAPIKVLQEGITSCFLPSRVAPRLLLPVSPTGTMWDLMRNWANRQLQKEQGSPSIQQHQRLWRP